MKKIIAAITVLALTAMPSFAAELSRPAGAGTAPHGTVVPPGVKGPMHHGPPGQAMKNQMMSNPQHLLMMAYHRSVANFGHALYQAAGQGATVPAQLARVVIAEMRRSTEEMEKYRAIAMSGMPVNKDRQQMMDEHLVQVKTHLRQLEDLAQSDPIDSGELKKHLQPIFEGCEGADCGMMPGPNQHGRRMYRDHSDYGGMHGCMCQRLPERGMMMEKMMQKIKSQDAELAGLVQEMKGASRDRKLDLVTEAVTRMVQQRADLTTDMENMQRQMMRSQGARMAPGEILDELEELDEDDLLYEDDEEMEDDKPIR